MLSSALKEIFSIHPTARAELTYLPQTTDILSMSKNLGLKNFCRPDGGKDHTITSPLSLYNQDSTGLFLSRSENLSPTLYL
jgi:hypothetical protein